MHLNTRNRVRAILHKLYNDAVQQQLTERNPVSRIPLWRETQTAFDYWHTIEECQAYLVHAQNEDRAFYIYAVLALNTGARISEILGLQNQDVDLANRRLRIGKIKEYATGNICMRTKSGAGVHRWLGLNQSVHDVLIEERNTGPFGKPEHFVVYDQNGNSAFARTIRGQHDRVCKKAGIKPLRIHDLRHTFASHFVMNGGSVNDLQALLGHSSPSMTQRYAHLAPGYLEKKANVVTIGVQTDNVKTLFRRAEK